MFDPSLHPFGRDIMAFFFLMRLSVSDESSRPVAPCCSAAYDRGRHLPACFRATSCKYPLFEFPRETFPCRSRRYIEIRFGQSYLLEPFSFRRSRALSFPTLHFAPLFFFRLARQALWESRSALFVPHTFSLPTCTSFFPGSPSFFGPAGPPLQLVICPIPRPSSPSPR